jgi:hypothetical protein
MANKQERQKIIKALKGEKTIDFQSSSSTTYPIEKDDGRELINILLTPDNAVMLFEILCELPYRKATSHDNEPPTEREEPVESVINQLYTQLHHDEEIIDDDEI